MSAYVYMCAPVHACMCKGSVCVCVCACVRAYMRVCVCAYMHACIHSVCVQWSTLEFHNIVV